MPFRLQFKLTLFEPYWALLEWTSNSKEQHTRKGRGGEPLREQPQKKEKEVDKGRELVH